MADRLDSSIGRIERLNYAIGGGLVLLALVTQNKPIVLGLAVGVALTCVNFYVLRRLVLKWTTEAAAGKGSNGALLMLPKMVGLMAAVAISVLLLPINVVAFAIGYSVFIVSIVVETVYSALRTAPDSSGEPHG